MHSIRDQTNYSQKQLIRFYYTNTIIS